jgi:aminoglycoside phosphotransferase (APT) family kinase protein
MPDPAANPPPRARGWDVRRFERIDSTNRFVLDEARAGAPHGLVAVADHQTAGRGRLGRSWEAAPGSSLLVSVLLRPDLPASRLFLLTLATGLALADALAQLHAIDPTKSPAFEEFLRPEPYADRQLRRWHGQWQRAQQATGLADEPALDRVFVKLGENRPPVPPPRVIHGDYGLANVMFDDQRPTRVQAVLDWELTALGDPLADLGALYAYWSEMGRILNIGRPDPVCHPENQPDLPSPQELVARYAEKTGLGDAAVEHLDWYVTLAVARMGVIVAGALARMDPETAEGAQGRTRTASRVHDLAEAAEASLGRPVR